MVSSCDPPTSSASRDFVSRDNDNGNNNTSSAVMLGNGEIPLQSRYSPRKKPPSSTPATCDQSHDQSHDSPSRQQSRDQSADKQAAAVVGHVSSPSSSHRESNNEEKEKEEDKKGKESPSAHSTTVRQDRVVIEVTSASPGRQSKCSNATGVYQSVVQWYIRTYV